MYWYRYWYEHSTLHVHMHIESALTCVSESHRARSGFLGCSLQCLRVLTSGYTQSFLDTNFCLCAIFSFLFSSSTFTGTNVAEWWYAGLYVYKVSCNHKRTLMYNTLYITDSKIQRWCMGLVHLKNPAQNIRLSYILNFIPSTILHPFHTCLLYFNAKRINIFISESTTGKVYNTQTSWCGAFNHTGLNNETKICVH